MAQDINRTLTDLNNTIAKLQAKLEECCSAQGGIEGTPPVTSGPVWGEPEDEWPDEPAYVTARCRAANAIYDTILEFIQWLDVNNVDLKAGLFGGLTTGIAAGILASGPGGWAIAAGGAIIAIIGGWIIKETADFPLLITALTEQHSELVNALYTASTVPVARSEFVDELGNATYPPNAAMLWLMTYLLSNTLLNNLDNPRKDMGEYQSDDPVVCASGIIQEWDFSSSNGGWEFEDLSTGGQATGSWSSPSWDITLIPNGGSGTMKGSIKKEDLDIELTSDTIIEFDQGGPSDSDWITFTARMTYEEGEESIFYGNETGPGTQSVQMLEENTLEEMEIWVYRDNGPGQSVELPILKVRIRE